MKKRFLSLLLIMSMLFTVLPAGNVFAQEEEGPYSLWAMEDLIVGDTYGIYPQAWYTRGMQKPITHAQTRVLISGLRLKLLNTERVIDSDDIQYRFNNNITVEDVLDAFYRTLLAYELDGDIGITDNGNAVDYMAGNGIFTGHEGELSLKDTCTVEQACVIATRLVTHLYDALDAASKGFLWEINSGENKVYLLGSVHMANHDIYPFGNKMLKAFAESDVLGVELDMINGSIDANMLLMQYGVYDDGTTLKDHVSEETYQKTVQVAANFGYTEEMISMFKPWAIFTMFSSVTNSTSASIEETAMAASLGIDLKFTVDAYMTGKPIVELEGYELQINMLASFSDELAEYLLDGTMDSIIGLLQGESATGNDVMTVILDYWHKGDVEGFMNDIAPLLVASELPEEMEEEDNAIQVLMDEYYNKLFTERDKGMAEKIDLFLKGEGSTTYFVVVGTGHYISEYSVIDILEEMGYEVNQVK